MKTILFSDLTILWIDSWWDGPLEGAATLDGEEVYFTMTGENEDGFMCFDIYKLTDEKKRELHERQADFVRLVGTYWDYRVPSHERKYVYTEKTKDEFYKKYPVEKDDYVLVGAEKVAETIES